MPREQVIGGMVNRQFLWISRKGQGLVNFPTGTVFCGFPDRNMVLPISRQGHGVADFPTGTEFCEFLCRDIGESNNVPTH